MIEIRNGCFCNGEINLNSINIIFDCLIFFAVSRRDCLIKVSRLIYLKLIPKPILGIGIVLIKLYQKKFNFSAHTARKQSYL